MKYLLIKIEYQDYYWKVVLDADDKKIFDKQISKEEFRILLSQYVLKEELEYSHLQPIGDKIVDGDGDHWFKPKS